MPVHKKKRKYEMGRPPADTKMGPKRVRLVRCRGGNSKFRALRLDTGNFSWGSEGVSRKTRILDVVYNASNNELVRTKTLVKNAIVVVDASPFKLWYLSHYGVDLSGKKKKKQPQPDAAAAGAAPGEENAAATEAKHVSKHVLAKKKYREAHQKLDTMLEEELTGGRVLACISSRPGQCGRCDGYILEGAELQFYRRKLEKKKSK